MNRLNIQHERDAAGELKRIVVRAPEGMTIDNVVWVVDRKNRKWRCAIGLVRTPRPPRRKKDH